MKAISIRQPWAFAIVMGWKGIENRDKRWAVRGPVWIHAGKVEAEDAAREAAFRLMAGHTGRSVDELMREYRLMGDGAAARGGIVGSAEIVDCVSYSDSRWFTGPYGLVLRNATALRHAVPCGGQLYAFDVPPSIEAACRANLGTRAGAGQGRLAV